MGGWLWCVSPLKVGSFHPESVDTAGGVELCVLPCRQGHTEPVWSLLTNEQTGHLSWLVDGDPEDE